MTGEAGDRPSDSGGWTGENRDARNRTDTDQCENCQQPRHEHARAIVDRHIVVYICDVNTTGVGGAPFDTAGDWGVDP